jgi:hypothetical protein
MSTFPRIVGAMWLLVAGAAGCGGSVEWRDDSGAHDTGALDATIDAGADARVDAATPDTAVLDSGAPDTAVPDSGAPDTAVADTGSPDSSPPDTGLPDTGLPDTGQPDAGLPDTGADVVVALCRSAANCGVNENCCIATGRCYPASCLDCCTPPADAGPGECLSNSECSPRQWCAGTGCGTPGSCTSRPTTCLDVYTPVCGCDGRTYSNGCIAASAGMRVARNGSCERVDK